MEKYYQINSFNFEVKNLQKGGISLGYGGILGIATLIIDEEEVIKDAFELTSTIKEFYIGIKNLFEKGKDDNAYFCCTCGDHGCAFIYWDLELKDGTIFIKMQDLIEKPIGKHFYSIDKSKFLKGILHLFDNVIEFMNQNNINKLDKGTLKEFNKMHDDIKSYLD